MHPGMRVGRSYGPPGPAPSSPTEMLTGYLSEPLTELELAEQKMKSEIGIGYVIPHPEPITFKEEEKSTSDELFFTGSGSTRASMKVNPIIDLGRSITREKFYIPIEKKPSLLARFKAWLAKKS